MAELNVEPKKSTAWWIWLLLGLIALALLFVFLNGRDYGRIAANDPDDSTEVIAGDSDDWSLIDRNAPEADYEEISDNDISVRGNEDYAIYSVDETILFDSDQTAIKADASEKLKSIAASAEQRFAGGNLRIYGYTDSEGSASHNKELAASRANAVQQWLVQNGAIPETRISVNPVGEGDPVASNSTEAGKALNRRVEIVVRRAK